MVISKRQIIMILSYFTKIVNKYIKKQWSENKTPPKKSKGTLSKMHTEDCRLEIKYETSLVIRRKAEV